MNATAARADHRTTEVEPLSPAELRRLCREADQKAHDAFEDLSAQEDLTATPILQPIMDEMQRVKVHPAFAIQTGILLYQSIYDLEPQRREASATDIARICHEHPPLIPLMDAAGGKIRRQAETVVAAGRKCLRRVAETADRDRPPAPPPPKERWRSNLEQTAIAELEADRNANYARLGAAIACHAVIPEGGRNEYRNKVLPLAIALERAYPVIETAQHAVIRITPLSRLSPPAGAEAVTALLGQSEALTRKYPEDSDTPRLAARRAIARLLDSTQRKMMTQKDNPKRGVMCRYYLELHDNMPGGDR